MANQTPIFDPDSQADSEKAFAMFVQTGDLAMMKLELKSNPSLVNAKDAHGTPALNLALQTAESAAETGIVDFLLDKGADPRTPDASGETPHRLALKREFTAAAEKIKRLATKLDMPDPSSALRKEFENVIQGFAKGTGRELQGQKATFRKKRRDSVNPSPVA